MSTSHEFREPDHFGTGAVGPAGQRVFYIQANEVTDRLTLKLEKQQVQALAQFLGSVLDDLPSTPQPLPPASLVEPVEPAWVVGQIAVGVDEPEGKVVLVVEELIPEEEPFDDAFEDDPYDLDPLADVSDGASARFHLTPAQARAFIAEAEGLMSKGRPPCKLCGQPESPGGHACPRLN